MGVRGIFGLCILAAAGFMFLAHWLDGRSSFENGLFLLQIVCYFAAGLCALAAVGVIVARALGCCDDS